MTVRTINAGTLAITLSLLAASAAFAQNPAAQPPPAQAPQAQAPAAPAPTAKPAPDYPDPRTLTLGLFYFATQTGKGGNIIGGSQATVYETVDDLGKGKGTPGAEASYPITRTGTVYAEYWIAKYDGNQTIGIQTNPFAQAYLAGSHLATTEKVAHSRFYLDDLLWPHSFPVPRFRLKSLWGVEWTKVSGTIDTPGVEVATSSTGSTYGGPIGGSHSVILPQFGVAAEYAITPHVLARIDGMGFGIPHHDDVWEADATLSWRMHSAEVVVGGKAMHYKTAPNSSEFFVGTVEGAFAEVRWHLSLF